MADEKPETKATEYVILRQLNEDGEVYEALDRSVGRGARAAVDAFLKQSAGTKEEGTYLAVPVSSFNLFSARTEQPPPVFRISEIEASGAADDTPAKTEEQSQGQPETPTLSGSAAAAAPEEDTEQTSIL